MLRTGCSPCPVVGGDPWTCRNRGKAATSERSCFDGIRWICGTCVPCRPILSRPVLSRLVLSFEADSRSRFLFSEAPGFSFLSAWKIIRNFTRFIIHRCGREPRFYSSWKKTTSPGNIEYPASRETLGRPTPKPIPVGDMYHAKRTIPT